MYVLHSNSKGAESITLTAATGPAAIAEAYSHMPTDPRRWRRLEQKWVDWGWPGEAVIAAWNVTPDIGTHQMWIEES